MKRSQKPIRLYDMYVNHHDLCCAIHEGMDRQSTNDTSQSTISWYSVANLIAINQAERLLPHSSAKGRTHVVTWSALFEAPLFGYRVHWRVVLYPLHQKDRHHIERRNTGDSSNDSEVYFVISKGHIDVPHSVLQQKKRTVRKQDDNSSFMDGKKNSHHHGNSRVETTDLPLKFWFNRGAIAFQWAGTNKNGYGSLTNFRVRIELGIPVCC